MKRVLFTICGRAGSKGIKNKNIKIFVGKLLPLYTLSAIDLFLKREGVNYYSDIVVNTDSPELIEIMLKNGLRKVEFVERSPNLAGDTVGKISVIKDTLLIMERKNQVTYDVVIDLDITSPLRTVDDISRLIDRHSDSGADVTTTITSARRNPYFNQVIKTERGYKKVIESNYTARQQSPQIFDMNASIYAYNPTFLLSGKGVLDGYCECVEMYDTGILDLDHEHDLELMEVIAKYLFDTNDSFAEIYNNI